MFIVKSKSNFVSRTNFVQTTKLNFVRWQFVDVRLHAVLLNYSVENRTEDRLRFRNSGSVS